MVDNVRLPTEVEEGAVGGPRFKVEQQIAMSGRQQRIQHWDQALGEWDISYPLRERADLIEAVLNLFYARGGPELAFRFKDWADFEFADVLIGTGDGSTDTFQLFKTYTDTVRTYTYTIYLPVSGTVEIAVNGVTKTETTHYTINYSTGVVTFTGGNIPTAGQPIRASGEFDRSVIFADDQLKISMLMVTSTSSIGSIPRITIKEVLGE